MFVYIFEKFVNFSKVENVKFKKDTESERPIFSWNYSVKSKHKVFKG